MNLMLIPLQLLRLKKKRKTMLLLLKSLSRGSTEIFISTSLENRIFRGSGKLFTEFTYKFAKE